MIKILQRIFFHETSLNDKLLILNICLIYAVGSSCFIGISVWFKQPAILCGDHKSMHQSPCTEEFACHDPKVIHHINYKTGPQTLAAELSLICDRKFYQRMLLSMIFFGGFLGCLLNAIIYVTPTRRKAALAFLGFALVIAKIGVLCLYEYIYFVGFFLGMTAFCCIIINSYCFALVNEVFTGEISKIATVAMPLCWGCFGVFFAGFCYIIDCNWRIIFLTISVLVFLLSSSLLLIDNEKGIKEGAAKGVYIFILLMKDEIFQ